MSLPLLISPCTIKSRSSLLAPAHPCGPGKRDVKWLWCDGGGGGLGLAFCVFFRFSSDCFVLVLFAFVVLGLVSSVLRYAKRFARKNVSEMTYFVLSGTQNNFSSGFLPFVTV